MKIFLKQVMKMIYLCKYVLERESFINKKKMFGCVKNLVRKWFFFFFFSKHIENGLSLQKYFFKFFKKILKQDENRFLGLHEKGFEGPKNMHSVGV